MAYLFHITLALGLVVVAAEGFALDGEHPWAVLALALVPHALAWSVRRLGVSGRFMLAGWILALLRISGVVCHGVAVLGLGWLKSASRWNGAPVDVWSWPGIELFFFLAPYVVFSVLAIDARARLRDRRTAEVAEFRRYELRSFFALSSPLVLLLATTSLIAANETLRAYVEHVGLFSALFLVALVLVLAILLPILVKFAWHTSPLPVGAARTTLETTAAKLGFRCKDVFVWHTGFRVANAAVIGVGPTRKVMFSDLLLAQLGERELATVFAHEIGHVRRHHVFVFAAWSFALFAATNYALTYFGMENEGASLMWLAALLLFWYFGFGWFSRRVELEADLHALETTGDVEALTSALERIGGPHGRAKDSWRHFGVERRTAFLRAVAENPTLARTLTRKLRLFSRAGYAAALIVACIQLEALWSELPRDRVSAALATGHYAQAAQLARSVYDLDPELSVLVARALDSGECAPTSERLVELGREALAQERRSEAREYFTLAYLRGDRSIVPELDRLEAELRTGSR